MSPCALALVSNIFSTIMGPLIKLLCTVYFRRHTLRTIDFCNIIIKVYFHLNQTGKHYKTGCKSSCNSVECIHSVFHDDGGARLSQMIVFSQAATRYFARYKAYLYDLVYGADLGYSTRCHMQEWSIPKWGNNPSQNYPGDGCCKWKNTLSQNYPGDGCC